MKEKPGRKKSELFVTLCKNQLLGYGGWRAILNFSWQRCLLYRKQFTDLQNKSMDWFLYYRNFRHERGNALLLAYIYWDILLDYDKITSIYASKYQRRMLLIKGTPRQIWKSPCMFVFKWKYYLENFAFCILRILKLFTRKVWEMFVYKHAEAIEYLKR